MRKIHCIASTLLILLLGSTVHAQKARRSEVPIANASGVKLRLTPSMKAKVVKALGVGDGVEVLRKAVSKDRKGVAELWAYVVFVRSCKEMV